MQTEVDSPELNEVPHQAVACELARLEHIGAAVKQEGGLASGDAEFGYKQAELVAMYIGFDSMHSPRNMT
jgi:hypothetical protein